MKKTVIRFFIMSCVLMMTVSAALAAPAVPATAEYSAVGVYNFFMEQDGMGDIHWELEAFYEEEFPCAMYNASAEIDGHTYGFFTQGANEEGKEVVYEMGIYGWYPDLEPNGNQDSTGRKVYKAFLETLAHFLPDPQDIRGMLNPENIYDMLQPGYSFNYQPEEWYAEYNEKYGLIETYHHNRNYLIAYRASERNEEDEIILSDYFNVYFSIN